MSSGLFKMLPTNYSFTNHIYLITYKWDLALNNLQVLVYHKSQPRKPKEQSCLEALVLNKDFIVPIRTS